MNYKALFIDLDDTLLLEDHTISPVNLKALRRLVSAGVHVVLCSGRPQTNMRGYAHTLFGAFVEAPKSYFISFNGAIVDRWDTQEELFRLGLARKPAQELALIGRKAGITVQVYADDAFIVEQESDEARQYQAFSGMECRLVPDLVDYIGSMEQETPKLLFHALPEKISAVLPKIEAMGGKNFNFALSKPVYIECTAPQVNKAVGMKFLLDKVGVSADETVAVGDSMNDLEMIREAGVGIAVANARDALKAEADSVLGHAHDEDALAYVAEHWF